MYNNINIILTATVSVSAASAKTFWFDDRCYTVINPGEFQDLPPIRAADPEDIHDLDQLRKPVWAFGKCPEVAYMPRLASSDSPLLARLSCHPRNLPIVQLSNGRYALANHVLLAWQDLETSLSIVSETLLSHVHSAEEAKFPFDSFWLPPYAIGYKKTHHTHSQAKRAILASRTAFFLLAARVTLAIAIVEYRFPGKSPLHGLLY